MSQNNEETKNIFQAMACVMEEIEAIGKDKKQQGFNYRGIDDVYNTLHPILSKHGIFTTPEALEQGRTERVNKNGTVLFYTTIKMKYVFWCKDGSSVSCAVFGEAMDSGDKSTAKAMSIAHKYALLQTFSIPTEELIDQEMDVYTDIQEQKPQLTPDHTNKWTNAKVAFIRDGNLDKVLERVHISPQHIEQLIAECNDEMAQHPTE